MTTYQDNVTGMVDAINRKRVKYAKEEKYRNRHGIVDLTDVPKPEANTGLKAIISVNNNPVFSTVQEDKGPDYSKKEDEYSKYDPEPDADQYLINSGATIIESRIELTDSQGRNRTLVRRSYNHKSSLNF